MRARYLRLLAIMVTVLAVGCKRSTSGPKPVKVEVISDGAQVEAARKAWAEDRERKLAGLLKEPGNVRSYDKEGIELLRGERVRSKTALERLRDDRSTPAKMRIEAIYELRFLEVPASSEQLAELGRMNDAAAATVLFELQSNEAYAKDQPLPKPLVQFVIDCIRSKDPQARMAAAHLAGSRKISEAGDIIVQQIRERREPEPELLQAAAQLRPSAEILDRLQEQLKQKRSDSSGRALGAIADLSEATQDLALKQRAARVCAEHLAREPNHPWLDGDAMSAIDAIAAAEPPDTARSLLQDLVRSGEWRLVREAALQRLEKIDAKLAQELSTQTALKTGGEASKAESRSRSVSLKQLAEVCTRHGVLTAVEAQKAVAEYASKVAGDPEDSADIRGLFHFAGRFLVFDVETGMVQNRHDLLLTQFAEASGGLFRPEAALERYVDPNVKSNAGQWVEEGKGRYMVQFIHHGKLYRFAPNDLGDWYDVGAVVKAIHTALAVAGIGERFVALESGGQDAQFIFGRPAAIEGAAKELGLELERDLDGSRKSGKEFEEKVLGKVKG